MRPKVDYFCSDTLRADLKGRTVRGGMIMGIVQGMRVLLGLATIPILTRLLDPEDFGLIAMVAVLTNFAAMFVDAGLSAATVQREGITHRQVSNLFWIAAGMGVVIATIVVFLAPAVNWFYNEPRLVAVTIALAVSFLLSGLTVQHQALLRRGMQFQALAVSGISAQLAGYVAAIGWAWAYVGRPIDYWALVWLPLVTAAGRMIAVWWYCPWRPGLPRRGAGTRELVVFGANLTGFNFVNYFARNADNLMIGRWWGETILGYYAQAYRILLMPIVQTSAIANSVVVPAMSRLRSSPDQYRNAYISAVRPLAWGGVSVVGWLFCTSRPLVLLYLGEPWEPVVPIFHALIPAAWATSFITSAGWVYSSWGHVDRQLKWGIAHSIAVLAVLFVCVPYGVVTVAYGISAAYVVLRIPGFYICYAGTPIKVLDLWKTIWRPTLIAAVASGAGFLAATQAPVGKEFITLVYSFAITSGAYLLAWCLSVLVVPGAVVEIKHLIDLAKSRSRNSKQASSAKEQLSPHTAAADS